MEVKNEDLRVDLRSSHWHHHLTLDFLVFSRFFSWDALIKYMLYSYHSVIAVPHRSRKKRSEQCCDSKLESFASLSYVRGSGTLLAWTHPECVRWAPRVILPVLWVWFQAPLLIFPLLGNFCLFSHLGRQV